MVKRPICGYVNPKTGKICKNPAGKGTIHFGEGRCYKHGGRNTKRLRLLEYVVDPQLREYAFELLKDPELLNLRAELAVLKARFAQIKAKEDDSDVLKLTRLAHAIRTTAQTIQEMEIGKQHYIHISVTATLVSAFADLGRKYIPDRAQRNAFARELEETIRKALAARQAKSIAVRALSPFDELVVLPDGSLVEES